MSIVTTVLVRSVAAESWDMESSTKIFAAGYKASILLAPSVVIMFSPLALQIILSFYAILNM